MKLGALGESGFSKAIYIFRLLDVDNRAALPINTFIQIIITEIEDLYFYENRILRRIFGPKRDENGEWRRLHTEELHSLYRSPNIVRVIKSGRLRWTEHVARMEEGRSVLKS